MTRAHKRAARGDSAVVFAALGDPIRLSLVARLGTGGPQSIARLTRGSKVTRQAITKHLRVLAGAGLVRGSRRGRESRWEMAPQQIEVARRYLDRISDQWNARLEALRKHVEEPGRLRGRAPRGRRATPRA